MRYIVGFLFILLSSTNVMADQLIVKEYAGHSGIAYVLNVDSAEQCINTITNLSNIHKYSAGSYIWHMGRYFKKEFTCVKADGTISEHAFIYQIPYSKEGKMCLEWSSWNGVNIIDECDEEGYTTRPIIFNGTLNEYIQNKTVD